MEPESLKPHTSPEQFTMPRSNDHGERLPLPSLETGIETGQEHYEQRSEAGAATSDASPILPPPVVTIPVVQGSPTDDDTTATDDTPLIANDDDLIEKEWVDKAKKIILETKDDPYTREEAVGKLQRDYLEKRYGRRLGSADDVV